jgi:hypothetical protein
MHDKEQENSGVPFDCDSALCAQQGILLARIDVLKRDAATHNLSENKFIHTLKQEYNQLVKKRARLVRPPLSDPMKVLPPDLWPDIIRYIIEESHYPIEKLLDLISVSKGWCSILTTLPVIWTEIWLDQSKPDYLAKAIMGIQLSGECEIDLTIRDLTTTEWREISYMIVAEGRRIRKLGFIFPDTDYLVIREVLEGFTKLPTLKELFLLVWPSQLSDQQHLHASLTEKMPSIGMLTTPGDMEGEIWNPYITSCSVQAESANKERLEALVLLPQLRHLSFSETDSALEDTPSLPKSSFGSVTNFTYIGPDVCRRLPWVGNNLSLLSIYCTGNGDLNPLLADISRFPLLHKLSIMMPAGSWGSSIQNKSEEVPKSPQNLVKTLYLMAGPPDRSEANWDLLLPNLLATFPCLDSLTIRYGSLTDLGWNCIQGVANLRELTITLCQFGGSSVTPLNMGSLRRILWTADTQSLVQVMARVASHSVQNLWLTENTSGSSPTMSATRYIVPGSAFPNITSLVISTTGLFSWDISTLSRIRELEVQGSPYSRHLIHWVSGTLEAILMRPRDNPALEKITLSCDFIEWDLLLLMLERRNFLNESGISSIKTFVFSYDLPYRLLYPISELLAGRFVDRDSNRSFSLEAIGDRVWDESMYVT